MHGGTEDRPETKFHINYFKLYSLSLLLLGAAVLFGWNALRHGLRPDTAEGPGTLALAALAAFMVLLAWVFWREASDRRPALEVTERGLIDRKLGEIPWEDIDNYRLRSSFFTPVFGYDLKPGATPPRGVWIYRWQGSMARLAGMPRRNFRKAMMVGGLEQMLEACRAVRPDLERR